MTYFKHRKITPYRPKANGDADRFTVTVGQSIETSVAEGKNWCKELIQFMLNYRAIQQSTTAVVQMTLPFNSKNRLARLVTKSSTFTRCPPLLRFLHWLPVKFRILFKINFLIYKTLHEKQPVYLQSMLAASLPSYSMRSNNDNGLSVPRVKTNTGTRGFHSCAPSFWNNLPLSVHSVISVATYCRGLV